MAGSLVWAHLSEEATAALADTPDPETQYSLLGETLGLKHYEDDEREHIVLDFLFHNLRFALDSGFTHAQTSAFFSVMKTVLDDARLQRLDTGAWPALEDCFAGFKRLVLQHSHPSDGGEALFSKEQVVAFTSFLTQTFFRHYTAYKVVFTREQDVEPVSRVVVVESPLVPPPLADAVPEGDVDGAGGAGGAAADTADAEEAGEGAGDDATEE